METQDPVSKSKPVLYLGTVLAVLVAVQGYIATIDGIPDWVKLVIGGVIVVLTVGLSKFTELLTVPYKNVVARVVDDPKSDVAGSAIAGPAAKNTAGVATGDLVQVTALPPAA